jgi:DedD protein
MPEGKKAYYQVSFTGGQALAAVVVMIAALVAAFFLGSKAAFEKGGEPEPIPARPAASVSAPPPASPAPSETSPAPAPEGSTTSEEAPVFEDREAGVEPPKPSGGGAPSSAPSRTELPGAVSSGAGAGAGKETGPAHSAPAAHPTPAAAAPAKPPAEKPSAARSGYFVQIVSTSSKNEANRWKEKLVAKKYRTAAVSSVDSKKGTLWRVRVGPYADKDLAKKAAAKITAEFNQKAWVAPE